MNAVHLYASDNQGDISALGIPIETAAAIGSATGQVDLCDKLVTEYISALPVDPLTNNGAPVTDCTNPYSTNYTVARRSDNSVTVSAPATEADTTIISVTR